MALRLGPDETLPVLTVRVGDLPQRVITVGDPDRAALVASRLDDMRELGRNREFVTYVGSYADLEVAVVSHGVGASGAGVCFEELCRTGATHIVRAGTAGGMQPNVTDGDLAVATAAVRDDGFTNGLVELSYPAVADRHLTGRLVGSAPAAHEGIVLTSAVFYPHDVLGSNLAHWARAGVIAVEMEVAALFVTASLHGVAAGAILVIDGNPLAERDETMVDYDPHRRVVADAVDTMVTVVLDAIVG